MKISRISGHRIAAVSLAVTVVFLVTICKENRALESYDDRYENESAEDESNGDEDDERDINFPFSESTSTYPTTLSPTKKRGKCSEDQIMLYLAELQVINPETIVQIASYQDLDRICRFVDDIYKNHQEKNSHFLYLAVR